MNRVLTEKGQDEVRYIVTGKTVCGSTVRIDEAAALRSSGMHLLVTADGASESCIIQAVKAVKKLYEDGSVLTVYFYTDKLSENLIRDRIIHSGLAKICCCVTSGKALRTAFDAAGYVLTVPDFSSGDFFTLCPAEAMTVRDGMLTVSDSTAVRLIECNAKSLAEALADAAAERSTAADD